MEIDKREYYHAESPQIIAELGQGEPHIVFNVVTHGNEVQPLYAVEDLLAQLTTEDVLKGKVSFTLSNPPALRQRTRYLHTDMNRAYPGNSTGVGEEKLAAELLPLVAGADFVVDFHTAPASPPVVILGRRDPQRLLLAEAAGIEPIVLFEAPISCAMVDFVPCGVGIELGAHDDPASCTKGVEVMRNYLMALGLLPDTRERVIKKYFEVVGSLKLEEISELPYRQLQDFVTIDPAVFPVSTDHVLVPFLSGIKPYTDLYCFLARQVERDYLTHY